MKNAETDANLTNIVGKSTSSSVICAAIPSTIIGIKQAKIA